MWKYFKKLDWILIASVLLLCFFGLLSIYSSSLGRGDFLNFKKQVIFFILGIILMFSFSFLDWRIFKDNPYLIIFLYFVSVISLAGLFFLGSIVRGVRSWYHLGFFSIDPIEFTKIILVILLAKYFSKRHIEMYRINHIIISGIYIFIPFILVFFQPNLGSALILFFLWIGILILSGITLRHFLILSFCAVLILVFSWFFLLKDYQKQRIVSFLNPNIDLKGIGWSQNQSKIAIGAGGIFGQGFGKGLQTQHGFLSEVQNDFIFAAIAEEFGFFGVLILLSLFIILISRIIKIAYLSRSNFPRLFASGIAIIIISQLFVHIGMNLGILPVIGLSLPFASYGGSGLVALFIGLGILQNIKINN